MTQLRAEDWNTLGFEPYAGGEMPDAVIHSLEQLETMQFAGTMPNNLPEHLADPAATFRLWHKLPKEPTPVMTHSTPCYKYLHTPPTGRSLDTLRERTGFQSQWAIQDGELLGHRSMPSRKPPRQQRNTAPKRVMPRRAKWPHQAIA
jgi:hypothetical protein